MFNENMKFVIWNVAARLASQFLSQKLDFSLKLLDPCVLLGTMATCDIVIQNFADVSVNHGQILDLGSTKFCITLNLELVYGNENNGKINLRSKEAIYMDDVTILVRLGTNE
jgi:hypothetical protein